MSVIEDARGGEFETLRRRVESSSRDRALRYLRSRARPHAHAHVHLCRSLGASMIPSLKIFAICVCVLSIQMLFLAALTAARRAGVKQHSNPEDVSVALKNSTLNEGEQHPDVARVQRAHRNMLESLPLFFGLGVVYVLVGASYRAAPILFITFTVARVLHSIVYLRAVQPLRTMSYAIGALSLLGMMAMIVRTLMRV
jgi:uncharacterized MAPEG superfamily protein